MHDNDCHFMMTTRVAVFKTSRGLTNLSKKVKTR